MKIFISYSRQDKDSLEKLYPQITATYPNDKIWYDKDLQGGEDWWERIVAEISECDIFLFLVSINSIKSDFCNNELREAIKKDKPILPVLIEPSENYPYNLEDDIAPELVKIHYVDIIGKLEDVIVMPRLWAAIDQLKHSFKTQHIQLSRKERWILSNQFKILAKLSPEDADGYHNMKEIVESGYEWEYDNITDYIYGDEDVMSTKECFEVLDILNMFDKLNLTYQALPDKSDIEEWRIQFLGFWGNGESKYLNYLRFCVERQEKYVWLIQNDRYDSHVPTLGRYRNMLKEWKNSKNKYNLTKDDVLRITNVEWE